MDAAYVDIALRAVPSYPTFLCHCHRVSYADSRLVSYLSREDSVKSLLQWVTSGLDDLDEEADKAADAAYAKALASTDAYPPFRRLSAAEIDVKSEDDDMFGIGLGVGLISQEEAGASDTNRFRCVSSAKQQHVGVIDQCAGIPRLLPRSSRASCGRFQRQS